MDNLNLAMAVNGLRGASRDLSLALFEMQVADGPLSMNDLRNLALELEKIREQVEILSTTVVILAKKHFPNEGFK